MKKLSLKSISKENLAKIFGGDKPKCCCGCKCDCSTTAIQVGTLEANNSSNTSVANSADTIVKDTTISNL